MKINVLICHSCPAPKLESRKDDKQVKEELRIITKVNINLLAMKLTEIYREIEKKYLKFLETLETEFEKKYTTFLIASG